MMLKKLMRNGEICMRQHWIEIALYKFLKDQLECKCHICQETFKEKHLKFLFYWIEDEEFVCDIEYLPSNQKKQLDNQTKT